ncbi:hypothetical protein A73_1 [Escherichia phage A73]|uniref:Uncharacterized protein n=1 Tax=Escherichia phage A73 TaxID=3003819 RepID=A0AAE9VXG5_9CAUD|nr:hypothetical protein A73_1 [Escherichia phage A73]
MTTQRGYAPQREAVLAHKRSKQARRYASLLMSVALLLDKTLFSLLSQNKFFLAFIARVWRGEC